MKRLPLIEKVEPDIEKKDLDTLSEKPLSHVLGASARMGMVLKPHEFQRLVLRRMGEDELLEELDRRHGVFRQVPEFGDSAIGDGGDPLDVVFKTLKKYIRERTALGTPFQIRVMMVGRGAKNTLPTRAPIGHSLLDKVSAAYNSYRRGLLEKLSSVVADVKSDPRLVEMVLGDGLSMMFKTASADILSADSVKYFLGAHLLERDLLCNSVAGAAVLNPDLLREIDHAA